MTSALTGRRARGWRAGEQSEKPATASERWATQSSALVVGRLRERREVIGAEMAERRNLSYSAGSMWAYVRMDSGQSHRTMA